MNCVHQYIHMHTTLHQTTTSLQHDRLDYDTQNYMLHYSTYSEWVIKSNELMNSPMHIQNLVSNTGSHNIKTKKIHSINFEISPIFGTVCHNLSNDWS